MLDPILHECIVAAPARRESSVGRAGIEPSTQKGGMTGRAMGRILVEMRQGLLLVVAALAVLLAGAQASASTGAYDGSYQGSISYVANVPDYGTVTGSAPLTFTVTGGSVSGSFTVPNYGTIAFSGSVTSSGSATATASYGCVLSMHLALTGTSVSVSGTVSGCSDQGGTASATISATRVSAPPSSGSGSAPPPPFSTVTAVRGEAYVIHENGVREAVGAQAVVQAGDVIETAPHAQVTLSRNGSESVICQNSIFVVGTGGNGIIKRGCTSFDNPQRAPGLAGFGPDCPFLSAQLRQICGDCPFISALGRNVLCGMASPVDARLLARSGRTDARGAKFTISTSGTRAKVAVVRGAIAVTSSGKRVVVKKGFATVILRGHSPSKPRKLR
jgi:hypothetical protein